MLHMLDRFTDTHLAALRIAALNDEVEYHESNLSGGDPEFRELESTYYAAKLWDEEIKAQVEEERMQLAAELTDVFTGADEILPIIADDLARAQLIENPDVSPSSLRLSEFGTQFWRFVGSPD